MQSRASSDISKVEMNSKGISNGDRPTLFSFLRGGDCQGYAPQSGEFIGHCNDQQKAQVLQDAVETDRKELDESKQMPAGAQSTDPGGDAEAQMEY